MGVYPQNTIAKFRNVIDLNLDPSREYEVCLYSVSFVKSWFNFTREALESGGYWISYERNGAPQGQNRINLRPGWYTKDTFSMAIKNIETGNNQNSLLDGERRECVLSYDNNWSRFRIDFAIPEGGGGGGDGERKRTLNVSNLYDGLIMSAQLALRTGFGDGSQDRAFSWNNEKTSQTYFSDYPIHFDPYTYFLLQSSLIKPNHNIGGGLYPVLAFVPCDQGEWGQRQTFYPQQKLWHDLSMEEKNHPEILFTAGIGGNMPFEEGTSTVTLVIREK